MNQSVSAKCMGVSIKNKTQAAKCQICAHLSRSEKDDNAKNWLHAKVGCAQFTPSEIE